MVPPDTNLDRLRYGQGLHLCVIFQWFSIANISSCIFITPLFQMTSLGWRLTCPTLCQL